MACSSPVTCDEGVCQLDFVVLEKCLEIVTPWVEDDLAPAFLVLELSLISSDIMEASAAEFFHKHADFVMAPGYAPSAVAPRR
jgi:hypothetical protein